LCLSPRILIDILLLLLSSLPHHTRGLRRTPPPKTHSLELDLFYQIVPEQSKFSVKGTKIEIKMAKKVQIQWPALEGEVRSPLAVPVREQVEECAGWVGF
jgi:hypothetical protein